jgi:hypothetical protein
MTPTVDAHPFCRVCVSPLHSLDEGFHIDVNQSSHVLGLRIFFCFFAEQQIAVRRSRVKCAWTAGIDLTSCPPPLILNCFVSGRMEPDRLTER